MSFVDLLKEDPSTKSLTPASESDICDAERMLNSHLSSEYKEYLMAFGVATTEKHEFTGLCKSKRLNVIDVTLRERKRFSGSCNTLYVVESIDIDHIIFWQDSSGTIYQSVGESSPITICNSLYEYVTEKHC